MGCCIVEIELEVGCLLVWERAASVLPDRVCSFIPSQLLRLLE